MDILFTNAFFDRTRYEGSRIHIEELTANLIQLGHQVWVPSNSPVTSGLKLSRDRVERFKQLRNIDVFYMRFHGLPNKFPRYLQRPWKDLLFRKPIVWEVESTSELPVRLNPVYKSFTPEELDKQIKKQAKGVRLAICITDGLAIYAADLGISTCKVVQNGSNPDLFRPDVPPAQEIIKSDDGLNVVWSGNPLIPWHDLDIVLDAANLLVNQPNIHFYIIGGDLPAGTSIPANVQLLGNRPYPDMPALLSAMDVGLATYKPETWSRYGVFSSPLKLFDYFASGLIVLASPIEQVLKCVRDGQTGYLVPFGDSETLARLLRTISSQKNSLEHIRQNSRKLAVDTYNWRRVAMETADMIQAVLP